jgi:hypothetical protein
VPARCAATIEATVSVTRGPDQKRMQGAARRVFRMRNGKDELGSPWLTALREAEILHQAKQMMCHCVHPIAASVYENRRVLSSV